MAEKNMGLMMELESTKRQVMTLQRLLTQKEEENRVKLADLASKMVCFRCGETMKRDEAVNRRSSIISFGRTTQEVIDFKVCLIFSLVIMNSGLAKFSQLPQHAQPLAK